MENIKEVKPLEGLGEIKFGFTRNQVKELAGEPTEVDTFQFDEEDEDELTESWHYDEQEMSFSFDEAEDWKLVNAAVSSENFTLGGEAVIGLSKQGLLDLIAKLDLGESFEDEENQVISVGDQQINFWFEKDEVSEVQWGVDWTEEGEVIYPK